MSENTRIVYVERPRSHGCLWGCLGVLLIVFLPLIVAWGSGVWFLWQGFKTSPMTQAAIERTQADSVAQRVLGRPITVVGVEGNAFSFVTGVGARATYVLRLQGPRGQGVLDVTAHTENSKPKIDALTLTGPDGQHYDLLHHAPAPARDAQPI